LHSRWGKLDSRVLRYVVQALEDAPKPDHEVKAAYSAAKKAMEGLLGYTDEGEENVKDVAKQKGCKSLQAMRQAVIAAMDQEPQGIFPGTRLNLSQFLSGSLMLGQTQNPRQKNQSRLLYLCSH